MQLSRSLIISLLESSEEFPIDFDDAWQWLGYTRKGSAKDRLLRNFDKDIDFYSKCRSVSTGILSATKHEQIMLTIDCFKSFGMMAGTEKGKEPLKLSLPPLRTLTDSCVFFFSAGEWLANVKASAAAYRLFFAVMENQAYGDQPKIEELMQEAKISRTSFYKATKILEQVKLLPFWVKTDTRDYIEFRIRDRLKLELKGEIEVITEVGLIDLLTPQEVIEIKSIQHWKTALGHVIAKGQVYPHLSKRIHLFGTSDVNLAKIRIYCSPLNVSVTFEKVIAEQIAV